MKQRLSTIREHIYWKTKLWVRKESRVALASYPRSGNTWVRVLLEKVTGEQAGSIHKDRIFTRKNAEGIVIKTHQHDSYKYSKAILLIRNPYDIIESYWYWKINISKQKLSDDDFDNHLESTVHGWRNHINHWTKASIKKLIIQYEELLDDPERNLKKMLVFLNRDFSDTQVSTAIYETSIEKMRNNSENNGLKDFFRKGEKNYGRFSLSPERIEKVKKIAGDLMLKYHYE